MRLSEQELPRVEVIIPTLNSMKNLGQCLEGILKQDYRGEIKITVIDGGSTDGTVEFVKKLSVNLISRPGLYMNGIGGAYDIAIKQSTSELIWRIDSDNIIIERNALENLIEPFLRDGLVNISIPEPEIDKDSNYFNRYLSWKDIQHIEEVKRKYGKFNGNYYTVDEMPYGLTNASIVKRGIYLEVGGFDSDVRVLDRLREKGLARCAIVPAVHFYHYQVTSPFDYRKKQLKRVMLFQKMSSDQLENFYVKISSPSRKYDKRMVRAISLSIEDFRFIFRKDVWYDKNMKWAAITNILVTMSIILFHPLASVRMFKKHFT